jgi:hypothetical protein
MLLAPNRLLTRALNIGLGAILFTLHKLTWRALIPELWGRLF